MFTHWRGRLPPRCRAFWDICRASFLRVISLYFERWVLQVYARTNNLHALPRLLRAPATNRVHGGVDPESVWSLLTSSAVVHRHKPYPKLYPHNNILLAKHTLGPMKLFSMLFLGGMYVIIATFWLPGFDENIARDLRRCSEPEYRPRRCSRKYRKSEPTQVCYPRGGSGLQASRWLGD